MAPPRKFDHEAILTMRGRGLVPRDIAARLNIAVESVEAVIRLARDRGDPRALRTIRPRGVAEDVPQPKERPGIMEIDVFTTDRSNDGRGRRMRVSLPHLSILGDWQGRAAIETGGEDE